MVSSVSFNNKVDYSFVERLSCLLIECWKVKRCENIHIVESFICLLIDSFVELLKDVRTFTQSSCCLFNSNWTSNLECPHYQTNSELHNIYIPTFLTDDTIPFHVTLTYGSYPSWSPVVVKNLSEFESCPKLTFARWPCPSVMAGTNPSIGTTLSNAISLPDLRQSIHFYDPNTHGSNNNSPFNENEMVRSFKSRKHPTMSPTFHSRPYCSAPWCHFFVKYPSNPKLLSSTPRRVSGIALMSIHPTFMNPFVSTSHS